MITLMARRDYFNWYGMADRTAQGRSASGVVLQRLGINGGGISAAVDSDSYNMVIDCKPTQQYDSSSFARNQGRESDGRGPSVEWLGRGCRE